MESSTNERIGNANQRGPNARRGRRGYRCDRGKIKMERLSLEDCERGRSGEGVRGIENTMHLALSSSWTKGREEGRGAGRENDFRFSARKIVGQSRGTNRDRHLSANWGHRGILIDPFSGSKIETDDRVSSMMVILDWREFLNFIQRSLEM